MNRKTVLNLATAVLSAAGASLLAGCAAGTATVTTPAATTVTGATISGNVHGGQQPVIGAAIQLYATGSAAGVAGYGAAATPLLTPGAVTTGQGGAFTLPAYTCPSTGAPVYLVATGGNPGTGAGNNPNLAEMAALGTCGTLKTTPYISVTELTTVASVYALAPFMRGISNIGTSTANPLGLTNAMADVNVLVNTATGVMPGSTAIPGATLPLQLMNTLADILAACVNSGGGTAGDGSSCGTLFANANPGGAAPTDTITALMDIAQHPATSAVNVAALFVLQSSNPPYQPTLTLPPNDFTLALTFSGAGLNAPSALAADASGNMWIANAGGNTVTELAHTGTALSGTTGYTASLNAPSSIAIAPDSTVWVTNAGNGTVSRLSTTGSLAATYTGLVQPRSIAFDAQGTAWVANNSGAAVTGISPSGPITNYAPAGAAGPVAIGVNPH